MKSITVAIILLVLVQIDGGFAQVPMRLLSDRPSQSQSPYTVGSGVFLIQSGGQYETNYSPYIESFWGWSVSSVVRAGITDRFELNGAIGYADSRREFVSFPTLRLLGVNALSLGCRASLLENKGIIPELSLNTDIDLPYKSNDFSQGFLAPRIRFCTSNKFLTRYEFRTNLGLSWGFYYPKARGFYYARLGRVFYENLNVFLEAHGQYLGFSDRVSKRLDNSSAPTNDEP